MINDFLIDFYSKKTDQQIDQDKINLINETYGDDYDLLISDLYSKYDEGSLDDDKLNNIKQNYGLLSSKTVENVEETTGQADAKEPIVKENTPKHVSIDKIQGEFEEDDVLKNLNDFYAEDIKNGLISFDTSGGMRDEITVITSAGETVIPLNSDFNTTSGFSSLPGREYTKYGEDGSYIDDRESFGKQSYNNLIKTIDSARIKSTPEQKALFKHNDDLGYEAETGTYPGIKAVTQEKVYFPYGPRTGENQEEISSPASTEQVFDMRNMIKTLAVENLINIEKTLNKEQKGFDTSTSTTLPGLAEMDPETNYENIKEKTYQDYVAASKKLNIPYAPFEDGFTAIWGTVKQEAINESKPEERYKKYKEQNTNIKSLDNTQEEVRNENWKNSLTTKEKVEADFYEEVKKVKKDLKDVNERLKSPSDSTGNESLVNQKLDYETKLKALTETFNTKYKESASRDINGFWINNRSTISDEERKKLNNVYKNSTTNAENILKNSQRSTLTPQEILEDQTNQATLEKLRTLQVGRNQKVKIRLEDAEIITGGIGGKIQTSENKVIRSLLQSGKLSVKDIKSGSVTMSYTDLIEAGLHTEDFEGFIDQFGVDVKEGRFSFSEGGFMSAKDIKDFKQFERQYYSELMNEQALMDFTYLNKDLAKMETVYDKEYTGVGVVDHLIGGSGTFIQSAAGAISEMVDGTAQDREQVEGFLGGLSETSTRADINAADKIIKDYNNSEYVVKNNMQIKLTDEQKENLDQSLGEAIYSGTGEFVPMVIELAAIDLATGGALGPAGVAKAFPRMGKIFQHILNAGIEEVKMQTLFDMPPTGGAAFYTFGAATKNMIKLKGPLARWQGAFDKIMVSGVSGMGASEFSKVSEAVYEDLMNEKTFRQSMNEAYGDLDEVQKRMIVSLGQFGMLGIHHLKKVDFMSTKAKYDLMDAIEIKASDINDKAATERGEYITNEKGKKVLNKEFKSIEEKEKYLTESEKSNLNQYSTDFNILSQYALNESMSNELDPKQVDQATFEKNFNKRYMDPVNRVLKSFDPEYKAPKILFGNSSENPAFRENFRSGKNSTAEITNDGSRMYFDLKYYTPGKALHEITHLGLQTYYKNNPEAKFRMLEKFDNMFKDVDVDLFMSGEVGELKLTGKQTKKLVEEGYKERSAEERMEEYLAFMVEGLSNPRAYYQNPRIMSGKLAEMRNYFKDVFKEMGANNIEPPQTAYDLIDLLASMGQSARQGTKIQNKFQTFMAALSDENTSFLNSVNIEAFKMAPERTLPENKYRAAASKEMASKDLTKEVEVSKSNKEIADKNDKIEEKIIKAGDTRVRDIKDQELSKEIKKELSENNIGKATQLANQAAKSAGAMALEPSKRVSAEEFKSGYEEQLARLIETYKPVVDGKRIPFGAYMQKNLKRRYGQILQQAKKGKFEGQEKRLGQEKAEGEKEFDIKSEDATPEEAIIASEERKAKVTPKSKITRDFPEIFTKELKQDINKSILEIFEGEVPGIETKDFKGYIVEASRIKLTNKIKKALGGGKNYEFSVKKMAEKMKETLDPRFFVRLESQTKPENRIFTKPPRRLTKQSEIDAAMLSDKVYVENTAQGVNIYEFKDFTPKQLSDYILAPTINPKTGSKSGLRGTRKTAFAEGLVDRLTRDATPQNLKIIGKEPREIAEISKKMQVDPSTVMASKDLTRTLIKAFKQIKNTGKLNKKELLKGITIEWEIEAIKNLNERRFKVAVDNDVVKLSDLKKLNKIDLEGDVRFFNEAALETIALKEGISIPEARERYMGEVVSLIKDGKGLKASIKGTTYRSAKERAEPENFKKSKPYYQDFIQRLIPEGTSFSELPASIQKMIMNTIGMGDHRGRTNGRKFTFKEYGVKEGNYIGLLEAVYNIKEASLKGKGPSIDSFAGDINIPSPGPSKTKASLAEGAVDFRAEAAKAILGRGQFNVDAVLDANKAALQNVYNSAKEVVKNAKNPIEALDYMIDLMLEQTNRSIGGIKGLAGVESITMEGMRGSNPELTKELHNEHLTELFSMTKDFGKMMERFIKGEQSEASVDLQLKRMVEDYNQGIISEARREIKDFDGSSKRSYVNNLIFLGKDATKQIPLRESTFAEAENMAEVIRNNATKTILDRIANTPYRKLTLAGVLAKQHQMNKAEYQKLKNQNIEVAKEASMASKDLTKSEMLNELNKRDKAFRLANERNKTIKKARVFDFDDTVARTNSKVFAERDGKRKVLTAEEFAKQGKDLVDAGWKMDFSDFNRVVEGKKGPLFELMKKMKEAAGDRDMFILTARAPESAPAIKEFLDAMGIKIPLENITGLGNSTGEAKADWLVGKASEGYNDFFFADDAPQNVKAVQEGMSRLDVKSKTQLVKASKDLKIDSERDKKKLNWKTDEAGNIKTTFEVAGKKYNFNLDARDNKGSFDVEFNLGGRIDITGTGNAVKVVRTVYNGLLDVVSKNPKIKRLEFSSLKSEQSRVKLYTTLMDRVAKKLGWETDIWETTDWDGGGSFDFEITKPRKKQVAPVEKVLEVIDIKSNTQKNLASKDLSRDFNSLIEESTGIGAEKVFSDVKAQVRGAKAKRQRFFIPPSAEDMLGLVYTTLGKGKKGEAHLKFYQENLFDPYTKAMENLSTDRVNLMSDFKALKKELDVPKDLAKKTESGFTNEQAVRVHLWNKMGEKIPGLSKTDLKELNDIVENNPKLEAFADQILSITKGDGYSTPKEAWAVGTITTDLIDVLNTKKRGKYLETWKQNKDLIYSKDNLNKLEAAYGPKYRAAVENSLRRMESGSNRLGGGNQLSNKVLDYINNSTGAIMFFNTRSAILQTISAANFINWGFNNPLRAGKAFANQPQYWRDFIELINSDYLKDRRNGLKLNINESEIANAAKTSGNKAKAGLNYILEKGYAPTKFADSFAIASGGATFYRNRINDLVKNEGKTEAEAKEIAMKEFRQVSETSQQSSDPSKISQQQSSDLGRMVLQFANTPMQYARIQKRAFQDIVNRRGDLKTNISKIAYYGFLQNMIFNALQQGLFALGFGDDEIDEKEEGKLIKAANGMLDSSLRGLGMAGVTVQVLKNLGIDIYDRSKRDRPEYSDSYKKLLDFSPAVKSKLGKFQSAAYPFDSKKRRAEVFEKGFSLDNPAYESMAKVVTGTTNLPLDRMYSKVNNLSAAMDQETETWQSVAMVLGWPEWQIKGRPKTKPITKEEKAERRKQTSINKLNKAKGSTDFETLKKLNKAQQVEMLKDLGYGSQDLRKAKKEADRIQLIIEANREQ